MAMPELLLAGAVSGRFCRGMNVLAVRPSCKQLEALHTIRCSPKRVRYPVGGRIQPRFLRTAATMTGVGRTNQVAS